VGAGFVVQQDLSVDAATVDGGHQVGVGLVARFKPQREVARKSGAGIKSGKREVIQRIKL
jgi:hypothetical protein